MWRGPCCCFARSGGDGLCSTKQTNKQTNQKNHKQTGRAAAAWWRCPAPGLSYSPLPLVPSYAFPPFVLCSPMPACMHAHRPQYHQLNHRPNRIKPHQSLSSPSSSSAYPLRTAPTRDDNPLPMPALFLAATRGSSSISVSTIPCSARYHSRSA
jgi:hypothetical protein